MKELIRTNNPVLLSWATAVLKEHGIEAFVAEGEGKELRPEKR